MEFLMGFREILESTARQFIISLIR